jgi:hypothetical protein
MKKPRQDEKHKKDEILTRCTNMWDRIKYRCKHLPDYDGVEIKMTKNRFLAWAVANMRNFLFFNPEGTPSVDRIDPDGHYEIGNIRIIDFEHNRIRSRFICSYLRLNKLSSEKDKISVLAKNIVATCQNAGIDKKNLVLFLRNEI